MARTIRERMNVRDNEVFTPVDLINSLEDFVFCDQLKFFGTNALSQFMDQTNPLAEITTRDACRPWGPEVFQRSCRIRGATYTILITMVVCVRSRRRRDRISV